MFLLPQIAKMAEWSKENEMEHCISESVCAIFLGELISYAAIEYTVVASLPSPPNVENTRSAFQTVLDS